MVHVSFPVVEPGPPEVNTRAPIVAVQGITTSSLSESPSVDVAVGVAVEVGVELVQLLFVITLESRVTAASLESNWPSIFAPVLAVMAARERT